MGIRNPPQIRILTNCDKYHEGKVQGAMKEYTWSVLGWSGGSKAILRNDNYYIPEYLSWGKKIHTEAIVGVCMKAPRWARTWYVWEPRRQPYQWSCP